MHPRGKALFGYGEPATYTLKLSKVGTLASRVIFKSLHFGFSMIYADASRRQWNMSQGLTISHRLNSVSEET